MERDVAIFEKEFFRKGLAGNNHVAWSLRFDSSTGQLAVQTARTSQRAYLYDQWYTPDQFRAKGDRMAKRVFENELRKLLKDFSERKAER
jgi:hypothetical protein